MTPKRVTLQGPKTSSKWDRLRLTIARLRSAFVHRIGTPLLLMLLPLPIVLTVASTVLLTANGQMREILLLIDEGAQVNRMPFYSGLATFALLAICTFLYYVTNTHDRETTVNAPMATVPIMPAMQFFRLVIALLCGLAPLLSLAVAAIWLPAASQELKYFIAVTAAVIAVLALTFTGVARSGISSRTYRLANLTTWLLWILAIVLVSVRWLAPVTLISVSRWIGPLAMTGSQLLAAFASIALASLIVRRYYKGIMDALSIWVFLAILSLSVASLLSQLGVTREERKAKSVALASDTTSAATDMTPVLQKWLEHRAQDANETSSFPVFIVAAEGGGIYAATAIASFLTHMRDNVPQFARHVFAVTGVSGGAVGAAIYSSNEAPHAVRADCNAAGKGNFAATPAAADKQTAGVKRPLTAAEVCEVLSKDHLSPVLGVMVSDLLLTFAGDLFYLTFYPFRDWIEFATGYPLRSPALGRRDCVLEASFKDGQSDSCVDVPARTGDHSLAAHWSEGQHEHALFLTTTLIQTGEPVSFAPFGVPGVRTFQEFGVEPSDVTVMKAALVSARFPVLMSPYEVQQGREIRYFVDGGYADNSGVATAARIYRHLQKVGSVSIKTKDGTKTIKPDVRLILMTSDDGQKKRTPASGSTAFVNVLGPLETLLNVRSSTGPRTVADLLDQVADPSKVLKVDFGRDFFLGWTISQRTRRKIVEDVTGGEGCNGDPRQESTEGTHQNENCQSIKSIKAAMSGSGG